jgi:hypothetical protein
MITSNIQLSDVLVKLAKKDFQIKLFVGYQDSINGYGWHVKYFVELIECIEYCPKCRVKYNVNFNDNTYPLNHQHSHRVEYKTIFANDFISENDMIISLLKFI